MFLTGHGKGSGGSGTEHGEDGEVVIPSHLSPVLDDPEASPEYEGEKSEPTEDKANVQRQGALVPDGGATHCHRHILRGKSLEESTSSEGTRANLTIQCFVCAETSNVGLSAG